MPAMEVAKLQQWVALTILLLVLVSAGFTGVLLVLAAATSKQFIALSISIVPLMALDLATSLLAVLIGTLLVRQREPSTGGPEDLEERIRRTCKEAVAEELKRLEGAKGSAPPTEPRAREPLGQELEALSRGEPPTEESESKEEYIMRLKVLKGKKVRMDDSDVAVRQAMKIAEKSSESKPTSEEKRKEDEEKGRPKGG